MPLLSAIAYLLPDGSWLLFIRISAHQVFHKWDLSVVGKVLQFSEDVFIPFAVFLRIQATWKSTSAIVELIVTQGTVRTTEKVALFVFCSMKIGIFQTYRP